MPKERSVADRLAAVKDRRTLRLTTIGRKTGKRHTVPVWFLVEKGTVFLVTMNLQRDWPRNIRKNGHVELDIGGNVFAGRAKQIDEPKRLAHVNALLGKKYWAAWLGSWFGMGPDGTFTVTLT